MLSSFSLYDEYSAKVSVNGPFADLAAVLGGGPDSFAPYSSAQPWLSARQSHGRIETHLVPIRALGDRQLSIVRECWEGGLAIDPVEDGV